jgi:hypothetical protein
MYEVKKLNVISVAKIQTFVVMAGYLVWAIIFSAYILILNSYMARYFFDLDFDYFGILAILVGLVVSGIVGFASGAIGALIYNLIASWIGGIKMDIELVEEEEDEESIQPGQ